MHWTISKGKAEGRLLIDPSDSAQETPLNCESVRQWTDEHVGKIVHPTLRNYVLMILAFMEQHLSPTRTLQNLIPRLRLFKMDLKGAFTLLNYHPDDAGLMSSALTDGLTLVSIVAGFGHTQTPAQFNHITRVLERVTAPHLHGRMLMYVDDVNGITLDEHLDDDHALVRSTAIRLLGPNAINDKKTESGHELTFVGYTFNLTTQLVSISEHTFKRATYAFYSTDTTVAQPIATLQRLASYSFRMDEIVPVMRPFSAALHHATRNHKLNTHVCVRLSAMAIRAVWLWRAFLVIVTFTRTFISFDKSPEPDFEFTFDASLQGIGSLLYSHTPQGERQQRGVLQIFPLPFDITDDTTRDSLLTGSRNQNLMEFCGILMSVLIVIAHGAHDVTIRPTGDSMVALSWAKSTRIRGGDHTVTSALIFALACMRYRIHIFDAIHIKGVDNIIPDALSRGYQDILETHGDSFVNDRANYYDLQQFPSILALLDLCNPLTPPPTTDEEFLVLWVTINALLDSLPTTRPHPN